MMTNKVCQLLTNREFVSIATCDFKGRPNVAPKFILNCEGKNIYLIDYVFGTTYKNILLNPHACLSIMDIDNLTGYQINAKVEIVKEGPDHANMLNELTQKQVELSAKRVIEAVGKGKKHPNYEVGIPQQIVIFKVIMEEIVEIALDGKLSRENLKEK